MASSAPPTHARTAPPSAGSRVRRLLVGSLLGLASTLERSVTVITYVAAGLLRFDALGRHMGETWRHFGVTQTEPDVADELRRRGHDVQVVEDWSDVMGHAQLIRVDTDGLVGASDPRADGAALGW